MTSIFRRPATALVLVLATTTVVSTSVPSAAVAADPPAPHVFTPLDDSTLPLGMRVSGRSASALTSFCGRASATPVPDGEDIVVTMPPAPAFTLGKIPASTWKSPPVADPTWKLNFYGFMYLPPLAARAAADGSTGSLETMITQVAAFYQQNPDVGSNDLGWDEGTALRRLEVLNCLYFLTKDERLVAPMTSDVAVQFSNRYYGPPLYSVHNHGLMANLAVVGAAELLNNPTWRNNALARIRSEAPLAFTKLGSSWEQSSMYQKVNQNLWDEAADTLAGFNPADPTVTAIRAVTTKAGIVYDWFTEPDGSIVQLGDSERKVGSTTPTVGSLFRDDQAGVAVGRWGAANPAATYYTLRYGPPRKAHGHQERSGVTFSAYGTRVLVNPGYFTYDKSSPYQAYQMSPAAANCAVPASRTLDTKASVPVSVATIQAPAHAWKLDDSLYGIAHSRTLNINNGTRTLIVADTYPAATVYRQNWHLDPEWQLVSGGAANSKKIVFRHTTAGRTLTITTTGLLSSILRGSTNPIAGWLFPKRDSRVPNPHLVIRSAAAKTTTTFVVS